MNLRDLLTQFNVRFKEHGEHEHTTHGFINADCPYCSRDGGRFRLGLNLAYNFATCWGCGPHKLFDTLVELTGASRREIAQVVGKLEVSYAKREERSGTLKLPKGVGPMLAAHRKYLAGRRFDPDEVERLWRVRGIGKDGGKLSWRLFIPVQQHGETVSWTTRSLSDRHERRYWSAGPDEEALPHKRLLYGADYVRHSAVVVEGPADVWRIGPGAVCTLGTSFTPAQLLWLSKLPRVCVCYDPEPHAQRQALRMASILSSGASEVFNVALNGFDPGSAPASVVRDLRRRFLDD